MRKAILTHSEEQVPWWQQISKLINMKMACIGAVIMGSIVFYINIDHGYYAASVAAIKQAAYTFFLGGAILRVLEALVVSISNPILAMIFSVLITTTLTVILIYYVHTLRGTPKPFESTLPTLFLAPFGFCVVAAKKRFGDWGVLKYL